MLMMFAVLGRVLSKTGLQCSDASEFRGAVAAILVRRLSAD